MLTAVMQGWRSWNSMGKDVTQAKMQRAMDKLVEKRTFGDTAPVSLADLGYGTVGLDGVVPDSISWDGSCWAVAD